MCRIVGRVGCAVDIDFEDGIKSMLKAVAHGGPDDEGVYTDGAVVLGHRRLSIIDLSTEGHQPMLTESSEVVISFNGEIYNYLELRKDLMKEGYPFRTNSDTEVILKAYQHWGTHSFDKLEGIFAFALYDKKRGLFYLVRDHIGVKPLYYFVDKKELLFASEVRAFKALRKDWKDNTDWKILFLVFGSIPHPYTTLEGVIQIPPGSYLELDLKKFSHQLKFYYQFNNSGYTTNSEGEALALMQFATSNAVRKNLIADAPLGVFLSGGIDSSLITLLADHYSSHIKTISVNFDEASYDEYPAQKMVLAKLKQVEHISHRVTEQMFWDQLDDIWQAMDQPSNDGVNSYFINRCAKNDGIKAVLSGLGADETFGGYAAFRRVKWIPWFRKLRFKKAISTLLSTFNKSWGRMIYLNLPGAIGDYLFLRGIYTPNEIAHLLKVPKNHVWEVLRKVQVNIPSGIKYEEYASLLETKIYMTNQLLKDTDCMGMWHGVEVRVPFLDIELLKKVNTIPPAIRYNKSWPKFLLTASNKELIPREIIFRKKNGFTFPFHLWMKRSTKQFKSLMPNGAATDQVVQDFLNDRCHWSKCWSLVVLKQFSNK